MSSTTYVRFEVLRTFRNVRFFILSLGFPVVLYIVVVSGNRNDTDFAGTGLTFALYYMVGMVAWGSMVAVTAGGARISLERYQGWVRQLRITPLRPRVYFGAKVLGGYCTAALSIATIYALGIAFGVRLPLSRWLLMTGLILIGLIPFAALGIWLGHKLTPDSLGPALGGLTALFALLGGAWGPVAADHGVLHDLVQLIPSYWLVQAAHAAFSGSGWPPKGWLVVAVWTAVFSWLAARAYRNDTYRA
jgi:ABC-2 type transport system permease protein